MSVFVKPFKVSDLEAFTPIEPLGHNEEFSPEFAKAIEDSGLAVTGIRNGKIWGCGGVHPIDEEQGELWMRLSKDCLKHKLDTLRWLRDGLKIIEGTFGFRQLNVTIRCGFEKSIKLVRFLGFVQTQAGQEWNVYSKRVREWQAVL